MKQATGAAYSVNSSPECKLDWINYALDGRDGHDYGDPAHTWVDVGQALCEWLQEDLSPKRCSATV